MGGDAAGDSPAPPPPLLKLLLFKSLRGGRRFCFTCLNSQLIKVPGEVFLMSFRTTATLGPVHNFIVIFPFKSSGGG